MKSDTGFDTKHLLGKAALNTYTTIHGKLVLSVESEHLGNAVRDEYADQY